MIVGVGGGLQGGGGGRTEGMGGGPLAMQSVYIIRTRNEVWRWHLNRMF